MKKIMSLVLAMLLFVTPCLAHADTETLFAALNEDINSAQVHTDFSIELNRPLEFLRILDEEDPGALDPVDVKLLAESVLNITQSSDMSYYISDDRKIVQASVVSEMNLPLEINDSFKTEIWAKIGYWININLEDVNKPICEMIYKVPFSTEYIVVDLSEERWGSPSELVQQVEVLTSKNTWEDLNKAVYDIILKHAKITEISRNRKYEIFVDDAAYKAIVRDTIDVLIESLGGVVMDNEDRAEYENVLVQFESIPMIGTDGIRTIVEIKNGHVEKTTSSLHIQCNLYDAMVNFSGEAPEEYNREDWWLDLTLTEVSTTSSINQISSVAMPDVGEQDDYNYPSYYSWYEIRSVCPVDIETERYYALPLRDIMQGLGIGKDEYFIEDGAITISPAEGELPFGAATMYVDSDKLSIDGAEIVLSKALYADETGLIYVPLDAAEFLTGGTITYIYHDVDDNKPTKTVVQIEKPPVEVEEEDSGYVSTYCYVQYDGKPIFENNALYMPLRTTMEKFLIDEEHIVWDNGVVTVTDDTIKEFSKLQLTANSNEIWINDQQHFLNAPVIIRNDSMYFPVEMMELLQCEMRYAEYYYSSDYTNITFYRRAYEEDYVVGDYEYDEDYYLSLQKENTLRVFYEGMPVVSEDSYYLPLWPLMGELSVSGDNITEQENAVYITSEEPITGFKTMLISENNVTKDDIQYVLEKPMIKANDVFYVPSEFVTDVLDGTILEVSKHYDEDYQSYVFRISVPNPLYNPES